ncbi:MAG: hypothetical protein N4A54_02830 [Peptostreptococcaceae bacterium]|jgi:hypothetical protein|nr:hypothetical protein [Peptostreptococcaceae bacterium]
MKMKKMITSLLLGAMVFSTASMSFAAQSDIKAQSVTDSNEVIECEDGLCDMDIEIKGDDVFINGEKIGEIDGTKVKIDEDKLNELDLEDMNIEVIDEMPSFDEFMDDMKEYLKDIDKGDLDKLEKLYDEVSKLDEAEKFDESDEKWEKFDEILDKYFKDDIKFEEIDCGEDINFGDEENSK